MTRPVTVPSGTPAGREVVPTGTAQRARAHADPAVTVAACCRTAPPRPGNVVTGDFPLTGHAAPTA
ncbi:hypothetical protein GCM10010492_06710 [Saccharothrix mutabilis subsp. mutabilis]|uniref:Uncharacterized protein n=1 Tax=Saccharothrix mutabilis subsp. mutabilis TaxID=66855 RepID=A0ABP3CNT0_9PSEU